MTKDWTKTIKKILMKVNKKKLRVLNSTLNLMHLSLNKTLMKIVILLLIN